MELNAKIPSGPIEQHWTNHQFDMKLVNPANKRKYNVIVVGSGLAGAGAAATMGELGYNVRVYTYNDSARRAHSIAAQGGINASKNYQNDGDSVFRLFYDTVKGGDFRSRESNVHRLAEVSENIIDQSVAQGVPFAREYGGLLANRSFGGAQVSRTFYARGQTGQQLLLGCYQALQKQVHAGNVKVFSRHEMMEVVVVDGVAKGVVVRDLVSGRIWSDAADAVVLATGGYVNVFYLSTNAKGCNVTAAWRANRKGAGFANPCFTQIHPTCIPPAGEGQSKLTLMSESLRNDGRIWVPAKAGDHRPAREISEDERDYYLERFYPSFGNLSPRDISSRRAKEMVDLGHGVGERRNGVFLDFKDPINRLGEDAIRERYGNLFSMYEKITGEDPYKVPMRIYPAPHYSMGGLWVDYNLQTTIPGLFAAGEANFSDHGANRLGASALMQGMADGYFVLPLTIGDWLARVKPGDTSPDHAAFKDAEGEVKRKTDSLLAVGGNTSVDTFHLKLGNIMWDKCGMSRDATGLKTAISEIRELREDYWRDVRVLGNGESFNQSLEKAGRVADFLEFAETMCYDALARDESCGAHLRIEHTDEEGEAKRDDKNFAFVSVWENKGVGEEPALHKEPLTFENVPLSTRSYK
jgi:succinate dehydrogenase / fumarate reductase flavoprotein subunit